ncbi:MAG: 6-pyruvoyl trahydropterin synthase family protein [Adlercreutzia equolifaciens]
MPPTPWRASRREGFALFIVPFRTTAENLAKWFFDALAARGLPVAQVEVYETPNNCAYYREQR